MDNFPLVSVILPVRNESAYIERGLLSILSQDYPANRIQILVADGMSSDNTRALIHDVFALHPNLDAEVLDNPGEIVPTGINIAQRHAKGEIIIRVDGHCIIASDYIRNCVKHIQNDGVDAVGGSMVSIGETPMAQAIAIGMSSPFGVGNSAFRTGFGRGKLVDTVPFPAYTRRIVEQAGFYDEELVRNQDDEYNYRIRELGGRILLAEDVYSTYFSRTSLQGLWRQYFQYGFWKIRVFQKHPRQMSLRQFVPPAFVFVLILSIVLLCFPLTRLVSFVIPLLYLVANLIASLLTAVKKGWQYFPLLPLIFGILHVSYGFGFLVGLVKFANRWGDKIGKVPMWERHQT